MIKNIFYKDCCDKFVDYVKKSHITTQNEPKSEKATQDVQKNCLSLTEQWKNGELEDSEYYIKSNKGDTYIDICANGSFMFTNCRSIEKVLTPVPSYEELEQLQNWADFTNDYHELREKLEIADYKNAELKELLKECRNWLKSYRDTHSSIKDDVNETICKIDEVLK